MTPQKHSGLCRGGIEFDHSVQARFRGIRLMVSGLKNSEAQIKLPAGWIQEDGLFHLFDGSCGIALRSQQAGIHGMDCRIARPLLEQDSDLIVSFRKVVTENEKIRQFDASWIILRL